MIRHIGDSYVVIVQPCEAHTTVEYIGPFQIARLAVAWTQKHLTQEQEFEIVPMDTPNTHDYDDEKLFQPNR
jgi:hypothetical protein